MPGDYPPADKWTFAPRYVEVPSIGQAGLITLVSEAVLFLFIAAMVLGGGGSVMVPLGSALSWLITSVVFSVVMSAPLEKGLLIAVIQRGAIFILPLWGMERLVLLCVRLLKKQTAPS